MSRRYAIQMAVIAFVAGLAVAGGIALMLAGQIEGAAAAGLGAALCLKWGVESYNRGSRR